MKKAMRMLRRVGCTSSVLKRDVSVKWLRSWIGLISESDIRQIVVQAESIQSPKKQRRTIEKSLQSWVHESGDVLIRRVIAERRLPEDQGQPGRRQFQAGKAETRAARAVK